MSLSEADKAAVIALLRERCGVDFSDYRARLVGQALHAQFERSGAPSATAWLVGLRAGGRALHDLAATLSVRVTEFFRDPDVFADLESVAIPAVLNSITLGGTLRAWVIGTATGEEAWSIAMVLEDACRPIAWEVLATDIDADALVVASHRLYSSIDGVPVRFREPFVDHGPAGEHKIGAVLASRVRFVRHQFMGPQLSPVEAIVPSFHLVSCRNVLLHFDSRLREMAWGRLAELVHPQGVLMTGTSESPVGGSIFRRLRGARPGSPLWCPRGSA